jgi:single-stranded DNA-binding protein
VSFFDVSCWTRLAEVCGESLLKGRGVRVVGRLKQDRWTDADGQEGGESRRARRSIGAPQWRDPMRSSELLQGKDGLHGAGN